LLQAWRRLAERGLLDKAIRLVLRPKDWMVDLTNALDVTLDDALEEVGDAAKTLALGKGSAIAAAAEMAAVSLQKRPDAEALWLAELARRARRLLVAAPKLRARDRPQGREFGDRRRPSGRTRCGVRPTAAAACSNGWWRSARRASSPVAFRLYGL